ANDGRAYHAVDTRGIFGAINSWPLKTILFGSLPSDDRGRTFESCRVRQIFLKVMLVSGFGGGFRLPDVDVWLDIAASAASTEVIGGGRKAARRADSVAATHNVATMPPAPQA